MFSGHTAFLAQPAAQRFNGQRLAGHPRECLTGPPLDPLHRGDQVLTVLAHGPRHRGVSLRAQFEPVPLGRDLDHGVHARAAR